jgi:antitoxin MazE
MKTRIIRIGNSHGIRIPKPFLKQTGLIGEVDIAVHKETLVVRPSAKARAGWAAAFREMARRQDDALLVDAGLPLTGWDEREWEW